MRKGKKTEVVFLKPPPPGSYRVNHVKIIFKNVFKILKKNLYFKNIFKNNLSMFKRELPAEKYTLFYLDVTSHV